jgi:hypothetical protein
MILLDRKQGHPAPLQFVDQRYLGKGSELEALRWIENLYG